MGHLWRPVVDEKGSSLELPRFSDKLCEIWNALISDDKKYSGSLILLFNQCQYLQYILYVIEDSKPRRAD